VGVSAIFALGIVQKVLFQPLEDRQARQAQVAAYPWLNTCDVECASKLGKTALFWIDSRSCEELAGMLEGTGYSSGDMAAHERMAILDKINSLHCR
jgi:hypothetical protein